MQRILSVHYSIPDYVHVSIECKHLLSRIFVANPEKVITFTRVQSGVSSVVSLVVLSFRMAALKASLSKIIDEQMMTSIRLHMY